MQLDEIGVYFRALTTEEIQHLARRRPRVLLQNAVAIFNNGFQN